MLAPATRRCCRTTHCHPPRHLTGCLPDRPLPSSFPDHSQTPLSISECQLAEHRKDIDQLQPLHVKQPLHRQYRVRNVCISLLHRYTYISYESSNQGLFPLSKMVVIRLVLEDCIFCTSVVRLLFIRFTSDHPSCYKHPSHLISAHVSVELLR